MKIAYLRITTWVDSAIVFGQHYYGKLIIGKNEIDVETDPLTENEVKQLNKANSFKIIPNLPEFRHKVGDIVTLFLNKERLKEQAIKLFKKEGIGYDILMEGDSCYIGPNEIFAGPENIMKEGNKLYKEWKEIEDIKENDIEIRKVTDKWQEIVYGPGGWSKWMENNENNSG